MDNNQTLELCAPLLKNRDQDENGRSVSWDLNCDTDFKSYSAFLFVFAPKLRVTKRRNFKYNPPFKNSNAGFTL